MEQNLNRRLQAQALKAQDSLLMQVLTQYLGRTATEADLQECKAIEAEGIPGIYGLWHQDTPLGWVIRTIEEGIVTYTFTTKDPYVMSMPAHPSGTPHEPSGPDMVRTVRYDQLRD